MKKRGVYPSFLYLYKRLIMKKKLIITENQFNLLVNDIFESTNKERIIGNVVNFLNSNYQPTKGTYKKGGEFHEKAMFINKTNEEMITVKSLFDYLKYKFKGVSEEFIKQIITDFSKGHLKKEYQLSKNVKM